MERRKPVRSEGEFPGLFETGCFKRRPQGGVYAVPGKHALTSERRHSEQHERMSTTLLELTASRVRALRGLMRTPPPV